MTKGIMTAVIYARVSSVGDRQSTARQVRDLSDYALYKKMDVCKVFEEHISGAKKNEVRKREKLKKVTLFLHKTNKTCIFAFVMET